MYKIIHIFIVLCYILVISNVYVTSQASAVEAVTGLTISPVRTELSVTLGVVTAGKVTVTNNTSADMTVDMSAEVFGVKNPAYDYTFDAVSSVVDWVRFEPQQLTLAPGKNKVVTYSINAPLGAQPGGQYIAVLASSNSKDGSGPVVSRQRVASLLYITVAGDVTRQGSLLSLYVPWASTGETAWSANIQNTGTAHFRSKYSVTVQTLWNSDVMVLEGDALILPRTIRSVTGTIPQIDIPGIYKVMYSFSMGDAQTAYETRLILYMPIYGWIILGLVLIYSVTSITRRITKHVQAKKTKG